MDITFNIRLIMRTLVVAFVVVIVLNLIVILLKYEVGVTGELFDKAHKKLYVDYEQNLPSYFNSILLLLASMLTGFIYLLDRNAGLSKFKWQFLSIIFLFLSLDESASIHEFFVTFLPKYMGIGGSGIVTYAWVIPYGIAAGLLGVYFLPSLRYLPGKVAKGMFFSGAVYVLGAVGFEMLGSLVIPPGGSGSLAYAAIVTCEESLEMLGVIIFIDYLLLYVQQEFKPTVVTFSRKP